LEGENSSSAKQEESGNNVSKIAVITGGSSGIGLSTAEQFAAEGTYVYITGRRQKELDAAVAQIGRNVIGVPGNVASLDRLYAQIAQEKGRVDILFANAGIGNQMAPLGSITEQQFDLTFSLNELFVDVGSAQV
jgi:NAD(P)-dependent dehydrogenase (short-subunit alcohol dehydrogenase family)